MWGNYTRVCQLTGQAFAEQATDHFRRYLGSDIVFHHDPDSNSYYIEEGITYRFTVPEKFKVFEGGLRKLGRQLSNDYLLGHIPFQDDDRIVETGGNDGDFSLALRETGKRMSLISFEPSPREHATLTANLAQMPFLTSHEAHRLALWNEGGRKLPFYVKSGTADSSVLAIEGATEIIEVDTVRLDEFLPRQRYKLLKLEAEGAEPEILEGATGILDCFEYITADVGFERGVDQESTLPQVVNILTGHGFRAVHFGHPRPVVLFRNARAEDGGA